MRRSDVIVFDHVSDIPGFEVQQLTWEELHVTFNTRYRRAGQPQNKLKDWLDDHKVGAKSHDPEQRVYQLDWFGLCSLMAEARIWEDEKHPPRSDLA
jgi:hypothetical protein